MAAEAAAAGAAAGAATDTILYGLDSYKNQLQSKRWVGEEGEEGYGCCGDDYGEELGLFS